MLCLSVDQREMCSYFKFFLQDGVCPVHPSSDSGEVPGSDQPTLQPKQKSPQELTLPTHPTLISIQHIQVCKPTNPTHSPTKTKVFIRAYSIYPSYSHQHSTYPGNIDSSINLSYTQNQGVTKRRRLSWLTNGALVYETVSKSKL